MSIFARATRARPPPLCQSRSLQHAWSSIYGRDCIGRNPTDRGRNATKVSALVDQDGLPLSLVFFPANHSDYKTVDGTLAQSIREVTLLVFPCMQIKDTIPRLYAIPSSVMVIAALPFALLPATTTTFTTTPSSALGVTNAHLRMMKELAVWSVLWVKTRWIERCVGAHQLFTVRRSRFEWSTSSQSSLSDPKSMITAAILSY